MGKYALEIIAGIIVVGMMTFMVMDARHTEPMPPRPLEAK